jgi:hypothetical protein
MLPLVSKDSWKLQRYTKHCLEEYLSKEFTGSVHLATTNLDNIGIINIDGVEFGYSEVKQYVSLKKLTAAAK